MTATGLRLEQTNANTALSIVALARSTGSTVGLNQVLAIVDLLLTLKVRLAPDTQLSSLIGTFAPVLCKNATEQQQFYRAYERWCAETVKTEAEDPVEPNTSKNEIDLQAERVRRAGRSGPWLLIGVIIASVIFAITYLNIPILPANFIGGTPMQIKPAFSKSFSGEKVAKVQSGAVYPPIEFEFLQTPEWVRIGKTIWAVVILICVSLPLVFVLYWLWRYLRLRYWKKFPLPELLYLPNLFTRSKTTHQATASAALRSAVKQLRGHKRVPADGLDLPQTLRATLLAGGYFSPVQATRLKPRETLILVETRGPGDHFSFGAQFLAAQMREEGMIVDCFSFSISPAHCYDPSDSSQLYSLSELYGSYEDCQLILMTDSRTLFDKLSGRLTDVHETLSKWKHRAVLTPTMLYEWSSREKYLMNAGYIIAPLSTKGLQIVAAGFDEELPIHHRERMLRSMWYLDGQLRNESLQTFTTEWQEVDEFSKQNLQAFVEKLREQLGEDNFLLLSTCALLPTISWETSWRLCDLIAPHMQTADAHEERLMELAAIPWFRQGNIPLNVREHLVSELPAEVQEILREHLANLVSKVVLQRSNIDGHRGMSSYANVTRELGAGWLKDLLDTTPSANLLKEPILSNILTPRRFRISEIRFPTMFYRILPLGWLSGSSAGFLPGVLIVILVVAFLILPGINILPQVIYARTERNFQPDHRLHEDRLKDPEVVESLRTAIRKRYSSTWKKLFQLDYITRVILKVENEKQLEAHVQYRFRPLAVGDEKLKGETPRFDSGFDRRIFPLTWETDHYSVAKPSSHMSALLLSDAGEMVKAITADSLSLERMIKSFLTSFNGASGTNIEIGTIDTMRYEPAGQNRFAIHVGYYAMAANSKEKQCVVRPFIFDKVAVKSGWIERWLADTPVGLFFDEIESKDYKITGMGEGQQPGVLEPTGSSSIDLLRVVPKQSTEDIFIAVGPPSFGDANARDVFLLASQGCGGPPLPVDNLSVLANGTDLLTGKIMTHGKHFNCANCETITVLRDGKEILRKQIAIN